MEVPRPTVRLDPTWPSRWHPTEPPTPVAEIPNPGQGHQPAPRRSRDNQLRFCIACDTVISRRATFCPVHRSERNAWTNRNPSTRSITFTPTEVTALHDLDAKIDNLVRLIGDATIGYQSLEDPPAWLDPLMIATKETVQAWRGATEGKIGQRN